MIRAGAPIWIDLLVADLERAKNFYGELLGWTFEDRGTAWGSYHIIQVDGRDVGGAMQRTAEMASESPDMFSVYLHVDDAAATAERVTAAGGTVAMPPMRVGDQGTMLGVDGPDGAYVGGWQPGERRGFQADPAAVGAPVWFELMSNDFDASTAFYSAAFGHEYALMGADDPDAGAPDGVESPAGMRYATNGAGAAAASGLCDASAWLPAGAPSYWRVYLQTDDVDAAVARVAELGGRLLDGPIDSPFGRVATVADDQGVGFQLIAPPARG